MLSFKDYFARDDMRGDGMQALVDDIRYVARQAVLDQVSVIPPMHQADLRSLDDRLKKVERRIDLLSQAEGRLPE